MSISDGTVLKIVVSMLMPDSVIAQNIFYSVVADLATSDDEEDVVTDLVTWVETMYANLNSFVADAVVGSDIKVYEYDDNDLDWDEVGTDTWADGFANTDDMLPHGCAALAHARTFDPDTQAGKYVPGFSEVACLDSDLTGAAVTAMANYCDDWVTAFVGTETGGTFGPGVWSTADAVFKLFIGTYVVNSVVSYQRRRKPGVGI
jgi:hypothetical protein